MSVDVLLNRLQRVRRSGPDSWMASCPGPLHQHGDRKPSLHITDKEGVVLLRCFSGCGNAEIISAVGLELSDLFPPRTTHHSKPVRHKAFKSDVFEMIRHEASVVWLIGCDLHKNRSVSAQDYERLGQAIAKLERIGEGAYES